MSKKKILDGLTSSVMDKRVNDAIKFLLIQEYKKYHLPFMTIVE